MNPTKCLAALFDFDGVVMDTEPQYTEFWNNQGSLYFPDIENFGQKIKGNTLFHIFEKYLPNNPKARERLTADIATFESQMRYEYVPGLETFMKELREKGVKIAIVTSSDNQKMGNVYRAHPEIHTMVDKILTADSFTYSKPHPECFLLGAELLGTVPENCVVFEDSFNGLAAGNAAGMKVVGLSTTNSAEAIQDKADVVIPDFMNFSYEKMMDLLK
ncbi:MAG: HAD family phosphatase [Bacteroides sp.]|nr:HAD family phosphatase [Bacteroides sp.]